jgi:hypothetical protein
VTRVLSQYFARLQISQEASVEGAPLGDPGDSVELSLPPLNEHSKNLSIVASGANETTGAHHRYDIANFDASTNPAYRDSDTANLLTILFQQGPVPDVGINGVTPEAVLVCLLHLFEGYQTSKFACPENEEAIKGFQASLDAIRSRTASRIERGVEGTHQA